MELTPLLRLALETIEEHKSLVGEICCKWLPQECKVMGVTFHHLGEFVRLGYLIPAEGNSRAWFKVVSSLQVGSLLYIPNFT
jgi:hypothetical protein